VKNKRKCGSCTKCCEGWLSATIYGRKMYTGNPCHFKSNNGCSIYKDRPKEPCKDFKCEWLINEEVPEWLKPEYCNVILINENKDGFNFIRATEAGGKMPVEVLNWLFLFIFNKKINLCYQVASGWNWFGSLEFVKYMESKNHGSVT